MMKQHGANQVPLLFTMLWMIWKRRNEFIFQDKRLVSGDVWMNAKALLSRFEEARRKGRQEVVARMDKWQPPEGMNIKVNCDGSFCGPGRGGVGIICRDAMGSSKVAMMGPVGACCSSAEVEAEAIVEGLRLARRSGFTNVIIESDAKEIITEIEAETPSFSLHGHVIEEIRNLSKSFISCLFKFVSRNCNQVADRLAKLGIAAPICKIWLGDPPDCVADLLFLDR